MKYFYHSIKNVVIYITLKKYFYTYYFYFFLTLKTSILSRFYFIFFSSILEIITHPLTSRVTTARAWAWDNIL